LLRSTNRLVFVMKTMCVFGKAGVESLYVLWVLVKFLVQEVKLSRYTKTLQVELAHCTQYDVDVEGGATAPDTRRLTIAGHIYVNFVVFSFSNAPGTKYLDSVSMQKEDTSKMSCSQ
jgi:hypothetical protein